MNVLQHPRNERNPCLKQNRPDRSYKDTLLTLVFTSHFTSNEQQKDRHTGVQWKKAEISQFTIQKLLWFSIYFFDLLEWKNLNELE